MKYILHYPVESFGYCETEFEGTIEEARVAYQEISRAFQANLEGLPRLEWNKLLDKYVNTATMEQYEYDSLSEDQKSMIQELKKCFKRIKEINK